MCYSLERVISQFFLNIILCVIFWKLYVEWDLIDKLVVTLNMYRYLQNYTYFLKTHDVHVQIMSKGLILMV